MTFGRTGKSESFEDKIRFFFFLTENQNFLKIENQNFLIENQNFLKWKIRIFFKMEILIFLREK